MTSTNLSTETYEERYARECAERVARVATHRATARAVAEIMGATMDSNNDHDSHLLYLNGRTFWLGFDRWGKRDRIEVSGKWPHEKRADGSSQMVTPRDVGKTSPSITVSAKLAPERIAKDIARRFMPEFSSIFDAITERCATNEARGSTALEAARELAAQFNVKVEPDGNQGAKLWIAGQPLRVDYYSEGGAMVYFSRGFSVSMDQARRILTILNEGK